MDLDGRSVGRLTQIRRRGRIAAVQLLLGVAILVAASAPAAGSDVGAGIGASPVVLSIPGHPGQSYRLPAVYVVNTGTLASRYHLKVEELSPGRGHAVPSAWVNFERNDFRLAPRQSTSVPIQLKIPAGAPMGNYVSDLVVGTVAASSHGLGAVAGAQAATKLMFTVANSSGSSWSWPWWAWVLVAIAVLFLSGILLQRRYGFRLQIERRR